MAKPVNKEILICPNCSSSKLVFNTIAKCEECQTEYGYKDNKYFFVTEKENDLIDSFDKIKYILKRYDRFYEFFVNVISPVYLNNFVGKAVKKYVHNNELIAINLGSGNTDISEHVSNVDLYPYINVDLTCNIEKLPFRDDSIDIIINIAVLEHVPCPEKVVKEIYRVLKKGGINISFVPFIQGFHASPQDFSRRTFEGMKVLFQDFDMVELYCYGGPTSGFLWIFQEWISLLLSFGNKYLHLIIYCIVMVLTFWLKYLDIILIHYPEAKNISSGFVYVGRKK